ERRGRVERPRRVARRLIRERERGGSLAFPACHVQGLTQSHVYRLDGRLPRGRLTPRREGDRRERQSHPQKGRCIHRWPPSFPEPGLAVDPGVFDRRLKRTSRRTTTLAKAAP